MDPPRPPVATLLLVDDEGFLRDLLHRFLAADGYAVLAARDGPQAVAVAERHPGPIDLLLIDYYLPDATGPEVAARLLALRPSLRTLYVTGDPERVRSDATGDYALLVKPFTPAELTAIVREALAG